jgi:amino acid transporter
MAWGGLQMAIVWIWIMIWSTAPEAAATFAPEYKDTGRDTRRALMTSAVFILFVNTMVPLALTGGVGAKTVEAFDYVGALDDLVGPSLTNFFVVVICASFIISMNTATADGSRALYGISKDGLTVKQLGRLNRWNVPGSAMSLDMAINIGFVLFVGNLFGILVASNIGYVFANLCAISAFILLRRDRPNWPRPIKLPSYWVGVAALLSVAYAVFEIVGVGWFQIAGAGGVYGGTKEKIIGFSVLVISLLLFLFRRVIQDKETPHWREETPTMPDDHVAKLLEEEMTPA